MQNETARVLIYGAGAIGSFIGYLLSDPSQSIGSKIKNVALIGRKGHMQKIDADGLRVEYPEGSELLRFKYCFTDLNDLIASDFHPKMVIVCVKTYSLQKVCEELVGSGVLQGRLKEACFLLLMNGMGNRETFDKAIHLAPGRVLEGITSIGVRFAGDGLIELKGRGKTVIEDRAPPEIRQFLKTGFEGKDFEIEFAGDFKKHQWDKLFVNSVINPITALTGQKNGIVLSENLRSAVQSIVRESVSVARKEGIDAGFESVLEVVYSVAEKTSRNTSSMLQDVQKKRTTEIDSINGYIIRLARKHSIEVPVNNALYGLVKSAAGGSCI